MLPPMRRKVIIKMLRTTPEDELLEVLKLLDTFERGGLMSADEAGEWRRYTEAFIRSCGLNESPEEPSP